MSPRPTRVHVLRPGARCAALVLALASPAALAQAGGTTSMGAVQVHHARAQLTAGEVLTSVDVLGADRIEDRIVGQSWELLGQMPGIQLTETRQGAESGKVSFRAFNGEGYLNAIKTLIDGIPSNVNSGNQRFIDMLFPLEIDYIEVVRGTNDPRYGLHNIGGNINFGTRQGGRYTDARLSAGSFGTRQLQLALGRDAAGVEQNYFVGAQRSAGARAHDRSEKWTLGGKWFHGRLEDGARIGLTARTYRHVADEPGFMTADELARDRRASAARNRNDGDERRMHQLALHADLALADGLVFGSRLYRNRYEDDRRVTFSDLPVGNAPRQRRVWDETQTGLLATLTWTAGEALTVEAGANHEHQHNGYLRERFAYAEPTDFDAPPARVQNDDVHRFDNTGAYVQAVYRPTPALTLVPGYRVDRFSGGTRLPGGVTAPLQAYGSIGQPKLGLVVALSDATHAYANWGRTFQVLTGSTAPAYLTPGQPAIRPSTNTGVEAGLRVTPSAGSRARLAVWQQDAENEVSNMPATGTTVVLGRTRRRGVDAQIDARVGERWTLWASHAYQEARITRDPRGAELSLEGREVAATPRRIQHAGVELQASDALTLGIQGRAQSDYYLEERNVAGKFGRFAVLDAHAKYRVSPRLAVDLQLVNLTDRAYAYAWYDSFFQARPQPMFSPAPGRAAYVSFTLNL